MDAALDRDWSDRIAHGLEKLSRREPVLTTHGSICAGNVPSMANDAERPNGYIGRHRNEEDTGMGKHQAGPENGTTVTRAENATNVPEGFKAGSRTERPHDPKGWNPKR
jgi:hypothetical protein